MTYPHTAIGLLAGLCMAFSACGPVDTEALDALAVLDAASLNYVEDTSAAVTGETIYVPAYSHIFHLDGSRQFDLTATLSVRNSDPDESIIVKPIGYYDSEGVLVRTYGERPFRIGPLASEAFVVEARDRTGGVGANFLVEWTAAAEVSAPVVEAVMISTAGSQGISLMSRGQVVRTLEP